MGSFDGDTIETAFRRIAPSLYRIDEGALFCMDRNYPWTLEIEEREGRSFIAEAFAAFPRLAELMPARAEALAKGELLGNAPFASEIDKARKSLGVKLPRRT
ncbi:MAG: hypothetical protein QM698_10700 [Micropepsaceae bacterium]